MAMTQYERINFAFKSLLGIAGILNKEVGGLKWYEEEHTGDLIIKPDQIWMDLDDIPPAQTINEARTNASNNPSIIRDFSLNSTCIHLTPHISNKAFFATSVFGDLGTRIKNLIMPQLIPVPGAYHSVGYMPRLYQGNPFSGGTQITTSIGGSGASPGWFVLFGAGIIVLSDDFTAITDPDDVWLQCFQYIGKTFNSITATPLSESITLFEEVIPVTGINQIGNLTYSPTDEYGNLLNGAQLIIENAVYSCESTLAMPSNRGFYLLDETPSSPENLYTKIEWNYTSANGGFDIDSTDLVIARYFHKQDISPSPEEERIDEIGIELSCNSNVQPGDLVYISSSAYVEKADNSNISTSKVLGIVVEKDDPNSCYVVTSGEVDGLSGLSPGEWYFLGNNGELTLTPPSGSGSVIVKVGLALTPNSINIIQDYNYIIKS